MSEASTHSVTVNDIDRLVSGATPQFSQQIAERVKALIAELPEGHEAREYGELQLVVLERLATGTTRGMRRPGVPAADRDRIVQRFIRLERSRTTPGHGLGLNLVAAVAGLHRARLGFSDNDPGLVATLDFNEATA